MFENLGDLQVGKFKGTKQINGYVMIEQELSAKAQKRCQGFKTTEIAYLIVYVSKYVCINIDETENSSTREVHMAI